MAAKRGREPKRAKPPAKRPTTPRREGIDLESVVAGAIVDFVASLKVNEHEIRVGGRHSGGNLDLFVKAWAKRRGLSLKRASVQTWNLGAPPPASEADDAADEGHAL